MLVEAIARVDGFVYEEFESAARIHGNLKVNLIEALTLLPVENELIVECLAEELADANVLSGVPSGGQVLAEQVAIRTGKPLLKFEKTVLNDQKVVRLAPNMGHLLVGRPRIGMIEDVTSTNRSLLNITNYPGMQDKILKAAVVFRRGKTAASDMTLEEITLHNNIFAFKPPLEYPLPYPSSAIINRPLPLWVPLRKQVALYLKEIKGIGGY